METKNLVILIVAAVVVFALGGALGMTLSGGRGVSIPAISSPTQATIKALSSEVVPSIVAAGQVSAINGNTVTLTAGNDSLALNMDDSTQIYLYTFPKAVTGKPVPTPVQQKLSLSQVKIGDRMNVRLKVTTAGTIQVLSAVVIPPVTVIGK